MPGKTKLIVPWLAVIIFLATGCSGPAATTPAPKTDTVTATNTVTTAVPTATPTIYPAGDHNGSLSWDGENRTYILHIPPGADSSRARPLVICLHGGGGTGEEMEKLTLGGFNTLADKDGFFVVYPDGIDNRWNDHRDEAFSQTDDVGFISELIKSFIQSYNVDSKRVYVTGISNGAQMSMCLAREVSDRLAAVAPVAYSMSEKSAALPVATEPISVLVMTGTQDPLVLWEGGEVPDLGGERMIGPMVSVRDTINILVAFDRCDPTPAVTWLPDNDPQDGTRVRLEEYGGGDAGTEVAFYAIIGGGHTWPGGLHAEEEGVAGKTCLDIDASEVIWEFFQRHSRYDNE
jgi:polyhydroxybutyrate depolymerase